MRGFYSQLTRSTAFEKDGKMTNSLANPAEERLREQSQFDERAHARPQGGGQEGSDE